MWIKTTLDKFAEWFITSSEWAGKLDQVTFRMYVVKPDKMPMNHSLIEIIDGDTCQWFSAGICG